MFDDHYSILRNESIRGLWPIWPVLNPPVGRGYTVGGRPVVNLTLAINYALGGFDVWGYHAVNVGVHALAALLLFGIVRRTLLLAPLRRRYGRSATAVAFAAASLWALHPLHTSAVTYIIQRAESIMGMCYLLTLYCVLRGATSKRAPLWYAAGIVACALGAASKEVMVTAPLVVLLYDRVYLARGFRRALRKRWGLYVGLAASWVVLAALAGGRAGTAGLGMGVGWWAYLRTQFVAVFEYLRLSLWPNRLIFDRGTALVTAPSNGARRRSGWRRWRSRRALPCAIDRASASSACGSSRSSRRVRASCPWSRRPPPSTACTCLWRA